MDTFAKLKDGRIMIIYSENTNDCTYNCYPLSLLNKFDCEVDTVEEIPYCNVKFTDSNLSYLKNYLKTR